MPKFDKRFVHFMWSDELEGKKVFYADIISILIKDVADGDDMDFVKKSGWIDAPFEVNGDSWSFVYYDPYYNFKLAYEQGKTIQGKHILTGEWVDMKCKNMDWDFIEYYKYELRIKEEKSKPVTNRELARWLAKGNGEYYKDNCDGWESHRCIEYQYDQDNLPVSNVMVRKWEDEEWHLPTREYMGLED